VRTSLATIGVALAAASAGCGELASRDYQPPPIAAIHGELTISPATGGALDVLLVWQPAGWTTEPSDVLLQANPLVSFPPLSCDRPDPTCGFTGQATCTVRQGLAEVVATVPTDASEVRPFVAPIFSLPPEAAFRPLPGGGEFAVGHLLFIPTSHTLEPVASSAFNGRPPASSSPYRTSYYVAYRRGAGTACEAACGDAGDAPPATNPGVLSQLPPGFSLLLKLEQADADGRLVPTYLASVPLGTWIAVNGHGQGEAGVWCDGGVEIEQTWGGFAGGVGDWSRCSTTPSGFTCARRESSCALKVARHDACGQPTTCLPTMDLPTSGRAPHAAFHRLPSGDVLAVGSPQPGVNTAALLYDTSNRVWKPTGSPTFPRSSSAAVTGLLSGKVLVTGGSTTLDASRTAELYDPATGAWTRALSMRTPRARHSATRLPSGEVLVIGGVLGTATPGLTPDAELFDPAEATWVPHALGLAGLAGHAALQLAGEGAPLLVTGSNAGPETYLCALSPDEPKGTCHLAGAMGAAHPDGTFTLLPSGKVLALGGRTAPTSAELFDPATETWAPAAAIPNRRVRHAAVVLPSGLVLVAGGETAEGAPTPFVPTADLYDPVNDCWTPYEPLQFTRAGFGLFAGPGEKVLAVGGLADGTYVPPAEGMCIAAVPGACGATGAGASASRGPR